MDGEQFGDRLQRLRKEANLTQVALCEAADVPLPSLRNWEQNRRLPTIDTASRLAAAIGVTLDQLAGSLVSTPKAKRKARGKKRPKGQEGNG